MGLSRRDALASLSTLGISVSIAGCSAFDDSHAAGNGDDGSSEEDDETETHIETSELLAVAQTLYPSSVEVTAEFLETYVHGRSTVDDDYREEIATAYEFVDDEAQAEYDESFTDLSIDERSDVLEQAGLERAVSDPAATDGANHARHYLLEELLYAFFTSSKTKDAFGNRNPPGYPGGTEAYQEDPV